MSSDDTTPDPEAATDPGQSADSDKVDAEAGLDESETTSTVSPNDDAPADGSGTTSEDESGTTSDDEQLILRPADDDEYLPADDGLPVEGEQPVPAKEQTPIIDADADAAISGAAETDAADADAEDVELADADVPRFGESDIEPGDDDDPLWTRDEDDGYTYVHRSSPGFDLSKWLVVGGVAAVFILLSFLLIPKLFSRDEGDAAASNSAPPEAPPSSSAPPAVVNYRDVVIASGPTHYWDFAYGGDPTADAMATSNLTLGKGVVPLGSSGVKSSSGALDCSGASNSRINSQTPETPTGDFSIEAWVNTATKQGGQVVSFGSDPTGTSSQVDRTLYVDGYGNASIGARGTKRWVASSEAVVNDGKWHHIVGTMSSTAGLTIYVDGVASGTEAKGTGVGEFEGFWRLCGDSLSSWPGVGGSAGFVGSIDEVAIYNKALTADEVKAHFAAGL